MTIINYLYEVACTPFVSVNFDIRDIFCISKIIVISEPYIPYVLLGPATNNLYI